MIGLKRIRGETLEAVNTDNSLNSLTRKEIVIIYNFVPYSLTPFLMWHPMIHSVSRGECGYHTENKAHEWLRGFNLAPERLLTKLSLNLKHTYLLMYL